MLGKDFGFWVLILLWKTVPVKARFHKCRLCQRSLRIALFGCSKGGGRRSGDGGRRSVVREGPSSSSRSEKAEASVKGFRKQLEARSVGVTSSKWLARKIIFSAVLDGLNGDNRSVVSMLSVAN